LSLDENCKLGSAKVHHQASAGYLSLHITSCLFIMPLILQSIALYSLHD
jgi:hypothetical protein